MYNINFWLLLLFRRNLVSAICWVLVPSLLMIGSTFTPWESLFRTSPFNGAYDRMFIAAMLGIGTVRLFLLKKTSGFRKNPLKSLPNSYSWNNGLDLFELTLLACLTILNFLAGTAGSGFVWLFFFIVLLSMTFFLSRIESGGTFSPLFFTKVSSSVRIRLIYAIFLVVIGTVFIVFPVLQSWEGPPEPFVRWHPFSLEGELIWRGIFLSFALGMFYAALDPFGKHRYFTVMLIASGLLHATEMLVDYLVSASMQWMNGNMEHLYGDIAGWYVVALVSWLALARGSRLNQH